MCVLVFWCVCIYYGLSLPVSRISLCVVVSAARCMVLAPKQVLLNGECVLETWTRPCETGCSLNLLGSIPAGCLNVGGTQSTKMDFSPSTLPTRLLSSSVSNSLNHLLPFLLPTLSSGLCSLLCYFCLSLLSPFRFRMQKTHQQAKYFKVQVDLFPGFSDVVL